LSVDGSAPGAAGAIFLGPLGEQLRRRMSDAIDEATALLDRPAADGGDQEPAALGPLIAGLCELAPGHETVLAEHRAALHRLRKRFESRFQALADVQDAFATLREITSPAEMLSRAPALLCDSSAFTRAVLSLIRESVMTAEHVHVEGNERAARAALQQLRAAPTRLEHSLIETELLRRRRATLVLDVPVHPRTDRRLAGIMGWRDYAAAPLVVGSQVIGVIHADRGAGGRLDVLDRDVLWEFANGLGQAYESAGLRRTLRHERDQMRQFLEWLNARSSELTDAAVTLVGARSAVPPPQALDGPAPPQGHDDRVVFEGLLTRRELDVLRLLAEGKSNKGIADALVISGGTVKFHVNSLMRKLRVSNRAEAVSRYLRLLGMRMP
jgi:LuxR family transcriptional regulator, regulator of acetate metabolism